MIDRQNFLRAASEAAAHRKAVTEKHVPAEIAVDIENQTVPKEIYDSFFTLQSEIEKTGHMDYHEYARRLWNMYIEKTKNTDFDNDENFKQFEANLINGFHSIDMKDLVYEDITKNLPEIADTLATKVSKAIMWSTGDVDATGYQDAKISSSKIVRNFIGALQETMPKDQRKDFIKNKTEYMVGDNKLAELKEYLLAQKSSGQDEIKISVIEDSIKNIGKVTALVKEIFGDKGTVVPVWATYSREGQKAKKSSDFPEKVEKYNGIDSFSNIATPEMAEKLEGSTVLIDFDGVIGDNVRMRNAQSQVAYECLNQAGFNE